MGIQWALRPFQGVMLQRHTEKTPGVFYCLGQKRSDANQKVLWFLCRGCREEARLFVEKGGTGAWKGRLSNYVASTSTER